LFDLFSFLLNDFNPQWWVINNLCLCFCFLMFSDILVGFLILHLAFWSIWWREWILYEWKLRHDRKATYNRCFVLTKCLFNLFNLLHRAQSIIIISWTYFHLPTLLILLWGLFHITYALRAAWFEVFYWHFYYFWSFDLSWFCSIFFRFKVVKVQLILGSFYIALTLVCI